MRKSTLKLESLVLINHMQAGGVHSFTALQGALRANPACAHLFEDGPAQARAWTLKRLHNLVLRGWLDFFCHPGSDKVWCLSREGYALAASAAPATGEPSPAPEVVEVVQPRTPPVFRPLEMPTEFAMRAGAQDFRHIASRGLRC